MSSDVYLSLVLVSLRPSKSTSCYYPACPVTPHRGSFFCMINIPFVTPKRCQQLGSPMYFMTIIEIKIYVRKFKFNSIMYLADMICTPNQKYTVYIGIKQRHM